MTFSSAHALVIGIGSYAHAAYLDVPITAADARAIAEVLRNPQSCGYPPEQVTLLADTAASRPAILAALDTLAARVSAHDTVFVFYAGHGAHGDDGYYLTTHDTHMAGRKVAVGTGIREAEMIAKLRAIKAQRLLFIVNACHAGEISPVLAPGEEPQRPEPVEGLTGTPLPPEVTAALLGTGAGRVIISACRENQYAFIGPGPLTLFTQALVDGLQGKGVSSNRGYISLFDLYTHLYFTLDDVVPRVIPATVRQRHGDKQEPELTILKGVGPFAVALYHGATTLGEFDASASPPEATAVRAVNPAYSQAMLRQYQQSLNQTVSGAGAVGIVGNVSNSPITTGSNNTIIHAGRDTIQAGGNVTQTGGDYVGGDKIHVGDISGSSGIAIGRGASSTVHHVDTGGGDYAGGSIDKRSGTFVSGDQFNMSGNFSGAMLNIKSTLTNVAQRIGAAPHGDADTKTQLQALIAQLSAELQKVPAEKASDAEAVAETAQAAVDQATKPQPNKTLVQISAEGLKQAAQNLAVVLPTVLPLAERIADVLRRMIGA